MDLPEYTPQQRWERAASQATVSIVAGIAYAKSKGQSAEEYGEFLAEVFAPGWGEPNSGSVQIIRGVHRNWNLWPAGMLDILEISDNSVTARANRPWTTYFGEDRTWYGVTLEEFEQVFRVFNERFADYLGLRYEEQVEGEWLVITFTDKN